MLRADHRPQFRAVRRSNDETLCADAALGWFTRHRQSDARRSAPTGGALSRRVVVVDPVQLPTGQRGIDGRLQDVLREPRWGDGGFSEDLTAGRSRSDDDAMNHRHVFLSGRPQQRSVDIAALISQDDGHVGTGSGPVWSKAASLPARDPHRGSTFEEGGGNVF